MFPAVGSMPMPAGFAHADVFLCGRPRHGLAGKAQTYDSFYRKHPPMETARRAKIFAPFDALRGFGEAIAAKNVLYEEKKVLTEGEKEDLDRKIGILHSLTANSRMARENRVCVTITRFVPCSDPENEAYGRRGRYEPVTGIVQRVDPVNQMILLDSGAVKAEAIIGIEIGIPMCLNSDQDPDFSE